MNATESVTLDTDGLSVLRDAMDGWVDSNTFPNAALLVLHKGASVFEYQVGTLDLEKDIPVGSDSLYRIYSMTKPITAVAAMMLVEQGKLGLDDPIASVLPEFSDLEVLVGDKRVTAEPMTLRHLLSHSAGLSYGYYGDTPVDRLYRAAGLIDDWDYLVTTTHDLVVELGRLPLLFQPGDRFHYSFASDVVGEVITRVSGKPLDAFLQQAIWDPLGIVDAYFEVPVSELDRFGTNQYPFKAGTFPIQDSPYQDPEFRDVTFLSGGGGLVMSLRAFGKFSQFLLDASEPKGHPLLKADTLRLMLTNQLAVNEGDFRYGLGFGIREREDPLVGGKLGSSYYWGGAAGTSFWIDPTYELAVVFFTQLIGAPNEPAEILSKSIYGAFERAVISRKPHSGS